MMRISRADFGQPSFSVPQFDAAPCYKIRKSTWYPLPRVLSIKPDYSFPSIWIVEEDKDEDKVRRVKVT